MFGKRYLSETHLNGFDRYKVISNCNPIVKIRKLNYIY